MIDGFCYSGYRPKDWPEAAKNRCIDSCGDLSTLVFSEDLHLPHEEVPPLVIHSVSTMYHMGHTGELTWKGGGGGGIGFV